MEKTAANCDVHEVSEEFEDLSFCNLSLQNQEQENPSSPLNNQDYSFEFPITPNLQTYPAVLESIVFCGKVITDKEDQRGCNDSCGDQTGKLLSKESSRSISFHLEDSLPSPPPAGKNFQEEYYYNSDGNNSKKHNKAFIGLTKVPKLRMELNDIKRRQSHRAPAPMFPVAAIDDGKMVVSGNKSEDKTHWGLLRTFKSKACLAGFRCFSIIYQ